MPKKWVFISQFERKNKKQGKPASGEERESGSGEERSPTSLLEEK